MSLLSIIQIVSAILLIATILLQQRGSGLSGAFGGEGGFYHTKRGIEKIIFISSIVLSAIFLATAILNLKLIK